MGVIKIDYQSCRPCERSRSWPPSTTTKDGSDASRPGQVSPNLPEPVRTQAPCRVPRDLVFHGTRSHPAPLIRPRTIAEPNPWPLSARSSNAALRMKSPAHARPSPVRETWRIRLATAVGGLGILAIEGNGRLGAARDLSDFLASYRRGPLGQAW